VAQSSVVVHRKHPLAVCEKCPLAGAGFARTTGPEDAKLAVVSRSPGHVEVLNGRAFAGMSGRVLDHLLGLQGVTRENVLLTNVVLCASDEPPALALECCRPRLEAEISQADTVIAAGSEAMKVVGSIAVGGIATNRGFVHKLQNPHSGKVQRLVVTNNPAMVIRDDATFPELVRDFRLAINPLPAPKLPQVKWIDNVDEAKQAVEDMLAAITPGTLLACDIEARGVTDVKRSGLAHTAHPVCAGFSTRTERAVVFGENPCYDQEFITDYLRRLYELDEVTYVWHNGKYDVKVLRSFGINARVDEDSLLLSWACDERPGDPESGAGGHSLEWLLKDELGWPRYEPVSVKHFKQTGELPDQRARVDLYTYNGMDTAGTLALFSVLEQQARNDNVWERPYKSQLIALSEALTKVELEGNLFDADMSCNILEEQVWPKLQEFLSRRATR
jgi:uracil-DNA glycosylase family 4